MCGNDTSGAWGGSIAAVACAVCLATSAHGDPMNDTWQAWPSHATYHCLTAWTEQTANGDTVYGYHADGPDGITDIYLTTEGHPLSAAEQTRLGVIPKHWSQRKAVPEVYSEVASRTARPKTVPRVYTAKQTHEPVVLPPLDLGAVAYEDALSGADGSKGALRTGTFVPLDPPITWSESIATDGEWTNLPNGTRIWSVQIDGPGAYGLRLHLSAAYLPAGVTLSVYPQARPEEALGRYDQGDFVNGEAWLGTLFADSVVLECVIPNYVNPVGLYGVVDTAVYQYLDLDAIVAEKAGSCNLDAACYGYTEASQAVAGLSTIGTNGSLWCTGTLVADADPASETPYFLTAFHCVSSQQGTSHSASNVELFWFYQAGACGGAVPTLASVPRTSGGLDFLAGNGVSSGSDFSLLRLRQPPPAGAVYLGWSAASYALGTAVVGIHHPAGSYKRIAFGTLTDHGHSITGLRIRPAVRFHEVSWNAGTTEPGSSGSPVLLANTGQLIGQLWGGYASCIDPAEPDYYGRFDKTFPIIERYLDPKAVLPPEDIDNSGLVDAADIQIVINAALGFDTLHDCDLDGSGDVDAVDIQRIINAVLIGV